MADEPKNDIADAVNRAAGVVRSALDSAGEMVGNLLAGAGGGGELTSHVVPDVLPLRPVTGGEEVATRVRLANDSESSTEPFTVTASDLVSDGGDRIPADAVKPAPGQRVVAAGAADTVHLTVTVPEGAAPGVYRGEVTPSVEGVAPASLTLEVR